MENIKSHITLILSLIAILTSIFLFRSFNQILKLYEESIVSNYSIILVSTSKIFSLNLENVKSIEEIDISKQIKKMQKEYKNINFDKITFPYFYRVKLNNYPSPLQLEQLKRRLLQNSSIKKIFTHSTSQTKIYNLLMLLKVVSKTFMIITTILGFLLIIKQLEVWKLIHSERMYIMELFGAPFWIKGAALFKIAIIDSFLAIISTLAIIFGITNSLMFVNIIKELNISFEVNYIAEFLLLFIVSFSISFISTIIVVISKK